MKAFLCTALALSAWASFAPLGQAQFPNAPGGGFGNPLPRPIVSPYLNILRGGDPAINYYGLVRPQIAFGKAFQTLGNEVSTLESQAGQPSQTGNRSSFMNHSRYFMNYGAAGGGGGRPTSQPAAPQRSTSSRTSR